MRSMFRSVLLALVVVAALAAVTASAASASYFYYSKTGKVIGNGGVSTWESEPGFEIPVTFECKEQSSEGKIISTDEELFPVLTVKYSGCTMDIEGDPLGTVTVSPVEYEFDADGLASIQKPYTLTAVFESETCKVTIAEQSKLEKVTYVNNKGDVKIAADLGDLKGTNTGGWCKTYDGKISYSGEEEAELEGGVINWIKEG